MRHKAIKQKIHVVFVGRVISEVGQAVIVASPLPERTEAELSTEKLASATTVEEIKNCLCHLESLGAMVEAPATAPRYAEDLLKAIERAEKLVESSSETQFSNAVADIPGILGIHDKVETELKQVRVLIQELDEPDISTKRIVAILKELQSIGYLWSEKTLKEWKGEETDPQKIIDDIQAVLEYKNEPKDFNRRIHTVSNFKEIRVKVYYEIRNKWKRSVKLFTSIPASVKE